MALPSTRVEVVAAALEEIRNGGAPFAFAWYPEGADGQVLLVVQARKVSAITLLSLRSADRSAELVSGELAWEGGAFVLRAAGIAGSGVPASLPGLAERIPALAGARCVDPTPVEEAPPEPAPRAEAAAAAAPPVSPASTDDPAAQLAAVGPEGVFVAVGTWWSFAAAAWSREDLWGLARGAPAGAPVFGRLRQATALELHPEGGALDAAAVRTLAERLGREVRVGEASPAPKLDPETELELALRADPRRVELRAAAHSAADQLRAWSERVGGAMTRQRAARSRAADMSTTARSRPYARLADDLLGLIRELSAADAEIQAAVEPDGARAAVDAWSAACAAWLNGDPRARTLADQTGAQLVPSVPPRLEAAPRSQPATVDAQERTARSAGEAVKKFKLQARSKALAEVVTAPPSPVDLAALVAAVRGGDAALAKQGESGVRAWAGGLTETLSQVLSWMEARASFPAAQASMVEANFAALGGLVDQLVAAAIA